MAVFHRLRSDDAVLTGGGRLVAAVADAATRAGLSPPWPAASGQGAFDEEDAVALLGVCMALRERSAQVPGQEVLEAFLRQARPCELTSVPMAADAWLALATDELRAFGFFARDAPTRPEDLPGPVTPSTERLIQLMLQDGSRAVPVTL